LWRAANSENVSAWNRSNAVTDHKEERLPHDAREYLAHRLDGARDLYLLALAVGAREAGAAMLGRMIREARIHFTAVIEECRIAGLDTSAIATMLGKMNKELVDSIRPEIWEHLEHLIAQRTGVPRGDAPSRLRRKR
jgi:ribulose 1,5-bisphosphate carboxylase large subunit-like protein